MPSQEPPQTAADEAGRPLSALDALPHAVAVLGGDGRIAFVNAAWRAAVDKDLLSGRTGEPFIEAFAATADRERRHAADHAMSAVQAVLTGGRASSSSQYRRRTDARTVWFHVSVKRRTDAEAGALVLFEDRTEAREHYTDAVDANRTLRDVLDQLARSAVWKDHQGRILGGNAAFFSEYASQNVVGQSFDEIDWPPAIANTFRLLDRQAAETGRRRSVVVEVPAADDRPARWLDVASAPLKRGDGAPAGIINMLLDVTQEVILREEVRRSEHRLRVALDGAQMGAFDCDLTTGRATYTDRCREMLLYDRGQFGDTLESWLSLVHPDDQADAVAKVGAHIRGATQNYTTEKRMLAKDRSWIWVRETGQIIERAADGTPTRLVGICLDITEEKQALERMKRTAARLRLATEASQIGTWEFDFKSGVLTWDDRQFAIYGQSPRSFNPARWLHCVHPDDVARLRAAAERMSRDFVPFNETYRVVRGDGVVAYIHGRGAVERAADGAPVIATGTTTDVTDVHTAAEAVLLAKQQLEAFVEHAPASVAMFDKDLRYIAHSRRWLIEGRWGDESLVGKRHFEVFPDQDAKWRQALELACTGKTLTGTEEHVRRPDGTWVWINWEAMPWRDHKGEIGGAIFAAEDVTGEIYIRRQLEVANKRLVDFVSTATDWMWETDGAGIVTHVSDRFFERSHYAREDVIGKPLAEFTLSAQQDSEELKNLGLGKDFRDLVYQLPLQAGSPKQGATMYVRASGTAQYDEDGNFTGYLGTASDITESVIQANAAKQAQKLQAVGTLAAGVAHEFNNILAIIRGHADLAKRALERGGTPVDDLGHVIEAAARGSSLTKGMLAFGRKGGPGDVSTFDIGELLMEQRMFLRPLTGPQFELVVERPDAPALVHANRDGVAQAIMNLVVNARDASPKGGEIKLAVDVVDASAVESRLGKRPAAGRFVRLRVVDNGVGMDEAVLQRIFEPFFTTKDVGKGTGLGLQYVYNLVSDSKGYLNVVSEVGCGTAFILHFPEAQPERVQGAVANAETRRYDGCTALVVDDEEALTVVYKAMLEDMGFAAIACADPEAALEIVDGHAGELDLIVTDVLMPKLEGPHFAELATALRPETTVLFVTGQPERGARAGSALPKGAIVLRKPFTRDDLAVAIAKAFNAGAVKSAA